MQASSDLLVQVLIKVTIDCCFFCFFLLLLCGFSSFFAYFLSSVSIATDSSRPNSQFSLFKAHAQMMHFFSLFDLYNI